MGPPPPSSSSSYFAPAPAPVVETGPKLEPWQEQLLRLQRMTNNNLTEIARVDLELKHLQTKIQAFDREISTLDNALSPLPVSVKSIFSPNKEGKVL